MLFMGHLAVAVILDAAPDSGFFGMWEIPRVIDVGSHACLPCLTYSQEGDLLFQAWYTPQVRYSQTQESYRQQEWVPVQKLKGRKKTG